MLISRSASQVTTHQQYHSYAIANNSAVTLDHMSPSKVYTYASSLLASPSSLAKSCKAFAGVMVGFLGSRKALVLQLQSESFWTITTRVLVDNHSQCSTHVAQMCKAPASTHRYILLLNMHSTLGNPANADCPTLECLNMHQNCMCKAICMQISMQSPHIPRQGIAVL